MFAARAERQMRGVGVIDVERSGPVGHDGGDLGGRADAANPAAVDLDDTEIGDIEQMERLDMTVNILACCDTLTTPQPGKLGIGREFSPIEWFFDPFDAKFIHQRAVANGGIDVAAPDARRVEETTGCRAQVPHGRRQVGCGRRGNFHPQTHSSPS